MSLTFSNQQFNEYTAIAKKPSALSRFFKWAEKEEEINHITWVGISITLAAAVLFPLTMTIVLFNGAFFGLIMAAMSALALVVVANLAALPTRYTIPLLFLSAATDIVIIVLSFFMG